MSTLLRRRTITTERGLHILRATSVPATRWVEAEVEAEAARMVSEVETEATEEVDIRRKILGVQNGRMSIRSFPHLHPD